MTPKQKRFIDEYLVDLNGADAARRAGYAASGSRVESVRLQKNPEIAKAIAERIKARADKVGITAEEVIKGLKAEALSAEESGSRVAAWAWLGKHLKLFTDKTELAGANGGPLQVSIQINRTVRGDKNGD